MCTYVHVWVCVCVAVYACCMCVRTCLLWILTLQTSHALQKCMVDNIKSSKSSLRYCPVLACDIRLDHSSSELTSFSLLLIYRHFCVNSSSVLRCVISDHYIGDCMHELRTVYMWLTAQFTVASVVYGPLLYLKQ